MRHYNGLGATNGPDPTITMWPAYHQNGVSNTPQNPPMMSCPPGAYGVNNQPCGGGVYNPPPPPIQPPIVTPPGCPSGMYDPATGQCIGGVYPPYPPAPPYPPVQPMPPRNPVYTFMYPPQQTYTVSPQPPAQLIAGISNQTLLIGAAIVILLASRK